MRTYEDLLDLTEGNETERTAFILSAILDYKSSDKYKDAVVAYDYFRRRNVTISEYRKLLYTMSGEAVPDNFSANYKFCNAFFQIFVEQENSYLLGNGITFNEDSTKDRLGGDMFDNVLMEIGEFALWGGVAYGFFNMDHVDTFKCTEFVPLIGEEDGALHAGIRWWQVASHKPLRATLYEEDGYTDYIWHLNDRGETEEGQILHAKRPYIQIVASSKADGDEILDGSNYPGFPIVPLWANLTHQSGLTGLREKIDGYDLIQSGFANDLDDASQIYWTIQNAGGMDDIDLAKFLERMKTVKAAVVEEDGAHAESHTVEVPYQARMTALADIRDSLYRDAMALDTDKISAGNITATAINAAYQNLDLKCDRFEMCIRDFIGNLLELIGIEDSPTFKRTKVTNMSEETQMVLSAAQYLDDETILKHLPFLSPDEINEVLENKRVEEAARFEQMMALQGNTPIPRQNPDETSTDTQASADSGDAIDKAEEAKGKSLNGAQTQSLIAVIDRYSKGSLSEAQAVNIMSASLAIDKDDARKILKGEE